MTSWIEPPPKRRGMGCIGKGCLLIVVFLILLVVAFVIGFYVGTKPKEIPQVRTSEADQNAVKARWDEFETGSRSEAVPPDPVPPAPVTEGNPAPEVTPVPVETPPSANRIELTANDINSLISSSSKARGKGFVSIDNDLVRVQITYPLDKIGLRGRFLNAELAVRPSPDRNPHNAQITQVSLMGIPEGMANTLMGSHSIQSYVDDFVNKQGITSFTIENNKVILEKAPGR
jgi:hypothetical protein